MNKEILYNDVCDDFEDEEYELDDMDEQYTCSTNSDINLTESDFYPPQDNRVYESNVEDIEGGDNFADYCHYFFELLDEEEYFDDKNI